ncbi:MAG TPA: hypothetical protein PLP29_02075 [Candidatus Ozemobacteraceae bacterium]|nr:hypothetical protein [Candidatus Ozemobacteraceae bacterium]
MMTRFLRRSGILTGIAAFLAFAGTGLAEPAQIAEFQEGTGEAEFGVSARIASDGPVVGPASLQAIPGGLAVLDSVNARIVKLDTEGKVTATVGLPAGSYTDLAALPDGRLWTIESNTRTASIIIGEAVEEQFRLPPQDGHPIQIDGLIALEDSLVVADYATSRLYWYGFDGTPLKNATWPTSLGIAADANGNVCFLGLDDADCYSRFTRIDRNGRVTELIASGPALDGARLLGFLPDGRAVACGYASREPLARMLFAIEADGRVTPFETIPTPGGLLFAQRAGVVADRSAWLNLSPLHTSKVVFARFDLIQ